MSSFLRIGPRTGTQDPAVATDVPTTYRWVVLGITSLGALLSALNSGTLVIALPDILRDLHTDLFTLLWIVVGYTLAATVLVLNAGRIADQVGRARSSTAGIAFGVGVVASLLGAVVSASRGKHDAFDEATVAKRVAA
jgi:MFS family permease